MRFPNLVRRRRLAVVVPLLLALVPCTEPSAQEAALLFDGIDDVATVASPSGWPFSTSALTVEAWIRPDDVSGTSLSGIVKGNSFVLCQDYGDNSAVTFSIAIGPTNAATTPTGALVAGRWDHFAATYDGVTMRIYQNGAFVAEEPQIVGGAVGIAGDVSIGFWPGAYGFTGVIDEVRIWNTVRTPSEIAAWMSRPLTGSEPDLLGYWRLEEGAGQVVADSTTLGNDGVLGMTAAVEPEDPQWTTPCPFLAFFADGFEDGDTTGWSASVP